MSTLKYYEAVMQLCTGLVEVEDGRFAGYYEGIARSLRTTYGKDRLNVYSDMCEAYCAAENIYYGKTGA